MGKQIRVRAVEGNRQRLDGGAMFGHVPKALWQRWYSCDEDNRIDLACRCMLIEWDGKRILVETGIGNFFSPKMQQRFGVYPAEPQLINSLASIGLDHSDIDYVFLSHLHFDHAGGLIKSIENDQIELYFPNARYLVGHSHWQRAINPHERDRASFIAGLTDTLTATGRLDLLPDDGDYEDLPMLSWFISNGHTPGLTLPTFEGPNAAVTFMGDLIPGVAWLHLPIAMAYDRNAELIGEEKRSFYKRIFAGDKDQFLFYTHDSEAACSRVSLSEKGKYEASDIKSSDMELYL